MEEPVDTSTIAVQEVLRDPRSYVLLMDHPFSTTGAFEAEACWMNGSWSLWNVQSQRVAGGRIESRTTEWDMSSVPSGTYVLRLEDLDGSTCAVPVVKAAGR